MIYGLLAQAPRQENQFDFLSLVIHASPVVQLVLLLLLALSVSSWAVILLKARSFGRAARESDEIWREIERGHPGLADLRDLAENYDHAPEAELMRAGFDEWTRRGGPSASDSDLRRVRNEMERATNREVLHLERYLPLLATTASASPFIGLFGTVWGIMNTFFALGASGSSSLGVVAPGIAEALIATAMGLVAAIPAVMAYNQFLQRIRVMQAKMDNFSSQLMDTLPGEIATSSVEMMAHDLPVGRR
ncbi:MAG: MotA/TolQ/ExbB proton channel family protein [Acidobacteriota bacterium]